jgi:polyisoprenoid-binding protein YceI
MALEKWQLDTSHSSISFSIRHLISKVRGRFGKWTGAVELDNDAPGSSFVQARIETASINTNEPDRDQHLRSADFFDVEKFPEITFTGQRVERLGSDRFRLTGVLTMHGVTNEIVLEAEETGRVKDPWGNDRIGFSAKGSLDRKDYGLTFNQALDAGGMLLGDRVDIAIEVEAVKVAQAAASEGARRSESAGSRGR